jgi:cytochrome c oxidase subunit 1/cytochrome c oxidase subunit I+III
MTGNMVNRPKIDVSALPNMAFGSRDPLWWGVTGLIAIETTMFALLVASYYYLRGGADLWPPPHSHPALPWGIANLALLLVSVYPMHRVNRAALFGKVRVFRFWLIVTTVLGIASLVLRGEELARLTFRWNSHAYGSLVWTLFGFHTIHLLTSNVENLIFIVLLFKGPVEKKFCADLRLNGLYWFFVVAVWVPVFAIIYLDPGLFR